MNMEKITKKNFTEIITTHNTVYFANVRKKAFTFEDLEKIILDNLDYIKQIEAVETRGAKKEGKYIVFSNGSRLDINDNKYNNYTTYIYRFNHCTVMANECKWYDTFDEKWEYRTIYYKLV